MNATSLIKTISTAAAVTVTAALTSCVQPAAQQQAAVQQQAGVNPYAVPGLDAQQQAQAAYPDYSQGTPAPYQQLPGVPTHTPNVQAPTPNYNYTPPTPPSPPTSTVTTHDVVAGESLWRISRKYGITVEALQAANGLKNDNIWAGQKLNIPAAQ